MFSQLVLLVLLSTGSVFAASMFNKKYEEILPITVGAIVLTLFLFGIVGILNVGVYFLLVAAVILYILSGYKIIKDKTYKTLMKNLITPGAIIFIFAFVVLSLLNHGKIPDGWDEFSHWALSVKSAVTKDILSTNASSGLMFKNYPPGVTLFLYFVEEISIIFSGFKVTFIEWKMYFGYQIFALSFLLPIFKNIKLKQVWSTILIAVIIALSPMFLFPNFYDKIYIDPILAVLSGVGFATILLSQKKDWIYFLSIFSVISMLVLAKDAGVAFAAFLFIAFVVDLLLQKDNYTKMKKCILILTSFTFLIIPLLLWNLSIYINEVTRIFSEDIIFSEAINVFLGNDDTYKTEVLKNFTEAIFTGIVFFGNTEFGVTYLHLLIIFCGGLYLLLHLNSKKSQFVFNPNAKYIVIILLVQTIIYILGILLAYMFKFSEYEAVGLAALSRYLNVAYTAIWIVIILSSITLIKQINITNRNVCLFIMLCGLMFTAPWDKIYVFATRTSVRSSISTAAVFNDIVSKINSLEIEDENIYFVAQESNGYHFWVTTYYAFPTIIDGNWSIGEPFYDGDIWTVNKTAEQWQEELMQNYDYVALYHVNVNHWSKWICR